MKEDTKSLLTNRFQKTYNAREVDARLRILNEKRTSFMSTNPLSYVVVDVKIHTPGIKYKVNDIIYIKINKDDDDDDSKGYKAPVVEFFVKEIEANGGIKKLDWDHAKTYADNLAKPTLSNNPESKRLDNFRYYESYYKNVEDAAIGESEMKKREFNLDHPDFDDPQEPYKVENKQSQGQDAFLILISRYADGDTPYYNDLGRMVIDDPLTQESRVKGMITQAFENKLELEFVGFISQEVSYDNGFFEELPGPIPRTSWIGEFPTIKEPSLTPPSTPATFHDVYYDSLNNKSYIACFKGASEVLLEWKLLAEYNVFYRVVDLAEGNLWLNSDVSLAPPDTEMGTGDPFSTEASAKSMVPSIDWEKDWTFGLNGKVKRWNGIKWTDVPPGAKYFGEAYYKPERLHLWSNLNIQLYDQKNNTDTSGNNDGVMNNNKVEYHIIGSVLRVDDLPRQPNPADPTDPNRLPVYKPGDAFLVSGVLYIWTNKPYVYGETAFKEATKVDGYNDSFKYDNDTDISSPNANIQNSGWYWFDSWRLFNFSLDESKFVHISGDETITGLKKFTSHIDVPETTYWVDSIPDNTPHGDVHTSTSNHYATMAQIVSSALLLSPNGNGAKQNVGGSTKFSVQHYIGSFDSTSDTPINDSPNGKKQNYDETNYYDGKSYYTPLISNSVFVVGPNTYSNFRKNVIITDPTESRQMSVDYSTNKFTVTKTGSLCLFGGAEIGMNLNVGGHLMVGGMSAFSGRMDNKDIVIISNGEKYTRGSQETTFLYPAQSDTKTDPGDEDISAGEVDGALRVRGGVNIGRRLIVRGTQDAKFTASNSNSGALTVIGGANIGERVRIESRVDAVSDLTTGFGALSVQGGINVEKKIISRGPIIIDPINQFPAIEEVPAIPAIPAIAYFPEELEDRLAKEEDVTNGVPGITEVGQLIKARPAILPRDAISEVPAIPAVAVKPAYDNIFNEGLRINRSNIKERSVIVLGGRVKSDGSEILDGKPAPDSNQLNIVYSNITTEGLDFGTAIGYGENYFCGKKATDETGNTVNAASIFIPKSSDVNNLNPFIRGTQIPYLSPSTANGLTNSATDLANNSRTTNAVVTAPDYGDSFYIPTFTSNNRGMITNLTQTLITIPNGHAAVGKDGIIDLYNFKPETQDKDNDLGEIGVSEAAARGDHKHPHDGQKANLSGATFTGNVTIKGTTTLSSTLEVKGATTLSSTLGVAEATTLSSTLVVTGDTSLNGTSNTIKGIGTASGTWDLTGASSITIPNTETTTDDASKAVNVGVMKTYVDGNYLNKITSTAQTVASAVTFSGAITASSLTLTSSRNAKSNILPFKESALDIIKDIDIVSFNYKNDEEPQVGFIAEDTDILLSGKDQKGMKINATIGLLLKAIQELADKK
jgi:hypothetical protein